jgi:hypothetical protein
MCFSAESGAEQNMNDMEGLLGNAVEQLRDGNVQNLKEDLGISVML